MIVEELRCGLSAKPFEQPTFWATQLMLIGILEMSRKEGKFRMDLISLGALLVKCIWGVKGNPILVSLNL